MWFINEVLPLIRTELPEAKLTLIGKNAPESLKNLKHLGVNCDGYVDSVKLYYHRASVFVAPLFVGSGVRIKILEAMAAQLPVVATRVSAEGIDAKENEGLFVSDNPKAQARVIIELLQKPDRVERAGNAAQEFIKKKYSWREEVTKIYNAYSELLNR
jgi:glycosyltransferase involved in cell wall biosynthesis